MSSSNSKFELGDFVIFLSRRTYPRYGTIKQIHDEDGLITINLWREEGAWTWNANRFFKLEYLLDLISKEQNNDRTNHNKKS